MKRRDFVTLLGGAAAAWPLAARAQQRERVRRIGVLIGSDDNPEARVLVAEFQQALEQLGLDIRTKHPDRHSLGKRSRTHHRVYERTRATES